MSKQEKIILAGLSLLLVTSTLKAQTWETYPDTWVAVDELGRNVAQSDEGVTRGSIDKNCTVGMFYYIWHGMHPMAGKDVTELLKENPDNPDWGAEQTFHWGSKPWLGYYTAGDKYVVAKHMQMLVDAGVDFLFLDATNSYHYPTRVEVLMREMDRREALGMKSPKLAFMVHSNATATAENIYNTFYKDSKYDKYWFEYEGKPLLLGNKAEISHTLVKGLVDRFTFRNSWAWMGGCRRVGLARILSATSRMDKRVQQYFGDDGEEDRTNLGQRSPACDDQSGEELPRGQTAGIRQIRAMRRNPLRAVFPRTVEPRHRCASAHRDGDPVQRMDSPAVCDSQSGRIWKHPSGSHSQNRGDILRRCLQRRVQPRFGTRYTPPDTGQLLFAVGFQYTQVPGSK